MQVSKKSWPVKSSSNLAKSIYNMKKSQAIDLSLRALSRLQKVQYSSFESLLIGVKQSWQYFIIFWINLSILRIGRRGGHTNSK